MMTTVLASPKIFADDTPCRCWTPSGEGQTKTGRLWCYAADNRPWCGPGQRVAVYSTAMIAKAFTRRMV